MEAIDELQKIRLQIALGDAPWAAAIEWAIQRLLRDEQDGDLNVVMLAASVSATEAESWTRLVLDEHGSATKDRNEAAAMTLLPDWQTLLRSGQLTLESLDTKLCCLLSMTDNAPWVVDLELQCECVLIGWEEQSEFDDFLDGVAALCRQSGSLAAFREAYRQTFTQPQQQHIQAEADEQERWMAAASGRLH
jgi:hypothetical protein